jgi:hypothetical protein
MPVLLLVGLGLFRLQLSAQPPDSLAVGWALLGAGTLPDISLPMEQAMRSLLSLGFELPLLVLLFWGRWWRLALFAGLALMLGPYLQAWLVQAQALPPATAHGLLIVLKCVLLYYLLLRSLIPVLVLVTLLHLGGAALYGEVGEPTLRFVYEQWLAPPNAVESPRASEPEVR